MKQICNRYVCINRIIIKFDSFINAFEFAKEQNESSHLCGVAASFNSSDLKSVGISVQSSPEAGRTPTQTSLPGRIRDSVITTHDLPQPAVADNEIDYVTDNTVSFATRARGSANNHLSSISDDALHQVARLDSTPGNGNNVNFNLIMTMVTNLQGE